MLSLLLGYDCYMVVRNFVFVVEVDVTVCCRCLLSLLVVVEVVVMSVVQYVVLVHVVQILNTSTSTSTSTSIKYWNLILLMKMMNKPDQHQSSLNAEVVLIFYNCSCWSACSFYCEPSSRTHHTTITKVQYSTVESVNRIGNHVPFAVLLVSLSVCTVHASAVLRVMIYRQNWDYVCAAEIDVPYPPNIIFIRPENTRYYC